MTIAVHSRSSYSAKILAASGVNFLRRMVFNRRRNQACWVTHRQPKCLGPRVYTEEGARGGFQIVEGNEAHKFSISLLLKNVSLKRHREQGVPQYPRFYRF